MPFVPPPSDPVVANPLAPTQPTPTSIPAPAPQAQVQAQDPQGVFVPPATDPVVDTSTPFSTEPSSTQAKKSGPASLNDQAQQIMAEVHTPGSNVLLDDRMARVLYERNKQLSWGQWGKEAGAGAWEGAKGIGRDFAGAAGELSDPSQWGRLPGTLAHGALQGTAQTAELARMLGRAAFDKVRDLGSTEEEKIQHFKDRYNENLISQRALEQGNNVDHTLVQLPDWMGKPLPQTMATSSLLLDPISLATMGTGGAAEAGAKVLFSKLPMAAKAAELAELASKVPGKATIGTLKGAEVAGRAVKDLAGKPAEMLGSAAEKASSLLPPEAASLLEKGAHLAGPGSIAAAVTGHGGPVTHVLAGLETAKLAGGATEQIAQAARFLAETDASALPRLLQVAHNPDAPLWIQSMAAGLHSLGAGKLAEVAKDYAGAGLHGAAMGTAMGLVGGETPEEVGQLAGGGAGIGMLGKAMGKVTGLDARAKRLSQDAADYMRFYAHLKAQGVPEEVIQRIQTGPATVLSRLGASQAKAIFGKNLDFRYLTDEAYNKAVPEAGKGTPAFFARSEGAPTAQPTIFVNIDKLVDKNLNLLTDKTYHELFHAIGNAVGADAEARLKIDSVLTPEEMQMERLRYADKLLATRWKADGKDPRTEPHWGDLVKQEAARLDDEHGDRWVYDEIYADAGWHYLGGKDMVRDIADPSLRHRLAGVGRDMAGKVFDALTGGGVDESVPRGAIFGNPKIYHSPVLERMFRDHIQRIYTEGAEHVGIGRETKEGTPPPVEVPSRMIDKHPALPGKMLAENGLVVPKHDGTFEAASPRAFRKAEVEKARAVEKALVNQPVKPKGDTSPEVAPRVNAQGEKEVSGTKIADQLAGMPIIGDWAKEAAKRIDGLMGTGNAFEAWYHAIGRSYPWKRSVRSKLGNLPVSRIALAPFLWKVSKENNVLAVGLSVTAADRKIARWKTTGKLNDLWGGDAGAFRQDLMTYLKNHADGKPGSEGIGEEGRGSVGPRVSENCPLCGGDVGHPRRYVGHVSDM